MEIAQATVRDLDALAPLFDRYRQFYKQPPNLDLARSFLRERFRHHDSILLLATEEQRAVGFTQLYPSWSSVGCGRIYVLNDLYVEADQRGRGVGRGLLDAACDHARRLCALRLTLSTATDNHLAQRLYEEVGWKRSDDFLTYDFAL